MVIFCIQFGLPIATMERGTLSNSLKGCKVKKSVYAKRSRSGLMLMPWERRHQHSMKDFYGSPRKKKSSVQDNPLRCSARSVQNLHSGFEEIINSPRKSLDDNEKDKCYLQREISKIPNLQQNGEGSVSKVITPRQNEAGVKFTSSICDGNLLVHNVSSSDGWDIPGQKSLSLAWDESTNSVLTSKLISNQGQALRNVDSRDKVSNVGHSASCVRALSTANISLNYDCCHQNLKNSPDGKYCNSPLNKTYICAAKYNLDQLFTCEFPQVKKPLKERLL